MISQIGTISPLMFAPTREDLPVDGVCLVFLECPLCGQGFCLCRSCYRRHVYCSKMCSNNGRQKSVKAARKKHRQSEEGRLDHRDQERERRRLKAEQAGRVGDHTSQVDKPLVTVRPIPEVAEAQWRGRDSIAGQRRVIADKAGSVFVHYSESLPVKKQHRCARCGRIGYLVASFPAGRSRHEPSGIQTVMRQ